MDRDAVLAAALGTAVLAGCTRSPSPPPAPSESPTPTPVDPDIAVLVKWLRLEQAIAATYTVASARDRAIAPLGSNHTVRADALAEHLGVRGVVPTPIPLQHPVRGSVAAVRAEIAKNERALATGYVRGLGALRDPKIAVLAAELAAGARQHATVLGLL